LKILVGGGDVGCRYAGSSLKATKRGLERDQLLLSNIVILNKEVRGEQALR